MDPVAFLFDLASAAKRIQDQIDAERQEIFRRYGEELGVTADGAAMVKELFDNGTANLEIPKSIFPMKQLQVDDKFYDKAKEVFPEENKVYSLPYAKYHGFSQHDCERVYSCPSCGEIIGRWGDPVAEIGSVSIAMCTRCNEWFRTS